MRVSTRELTARNKRQAKQIDDLIAERDEFKSQALANANGMRLAMEELSRGKDIIASHIVAAGHTSTVLHSPQACMESLREALAAAGFDLRVELARLEGGEL